MSAIENPAAFPYACPLEFHAAETGMSLRDWFAGQAIGHLAATHSSASFVAKVAYDIADAMLAARTPIATNKDEVG